MPQFNWSGRDAGGRSISGTLDAPNKEQVVLQLKKSGVVADEVRELGADGTLVPSRDYKTTFKFLFLALLLIAGAAAMTLISPVDVIRCAPDRSCVIEHRLAGLYVFDNEQASNLTTAEVTSELHGAIGSGPGMTDRYSKYGVEISGPGGKIGTFPKSTSVPSNEIVMKSVQQFLAAPNGRSYFMLQTEVIFVIPVLLVLLAVHFVRRAFRG